MSCDVYFKGDGVFVLGFTNFGGGQIARSLREPVIKLGPNPAPAELGRAVRQTLDLAGSPLNARFRGWHELTQLNRQLLHSAGIKSWTTLTTSARSFAIDDDGTRLKVRITSLSPDAPRTDAEFCGRDPEEIGQLLLGWLPNCPTSEPLSPARAGSSYRRDQPSPLEDGGTPQTFGYKTDWVVVDSTDARAVAAALGLEKLRPATWDMNPYGVNGVFVSPSVLGWTFVLELSQVGPHAGQEFDEFLNSLERLSRQFGEVQAYATHRGVALNAWAKAVDGEVIRALSSSESGYFDLGELTPEEVELGFRRLDPVLDYEGMEFGGEAGMMQLAGKWSINPQELDAYDSVGPGLIGKEPAS